MTPSAHEMWLSNHHAASLREKLNPPRRPHYSGALGCRKACHRASLGEKFHKPRPGLGVWGSSL